MSYLYVIPPIDEFFGGLTINEAAKKISKEYADTGVVDYTFLARECLDEYLKQGMYLAKIYSFFDGQLRENAPPVFFFLPYELEMICGVIFKQCNNGTTFVYSPVELPYLEEIGDRVDIPILKDFAA